MKKSVQGKNKVKSTKRFVSKGIMPMVACFLLSGFVVWWYLFLYPHISLFYREQSQMFLFTRDYLLRYLNYPAGLTAYVASFLIQFFHWRFLGVMIYLVVFLLFYLIFRLVLRKIDLFKESFFIAFIPGLLFLPASVNMLFDLADELVVIIALCGFLALTRFTANRFYFLLIPLIITILFIIAGGNVLLSLTLFVLYSFFRQPKNYLRQIATGFLSLLLPLIFWYFFYMTSFKNSCLALTHFRYPDALLFDSRGIAWWSAGILPVTGILLKKIRAGKKWIFIGNIALVIILLIHIVKQNRSDFENIIRMGFAAENHQWEDIPVISKKTSVSPITCLYTNLALQKTGQMAEKMFHYDQIGISGLFVDSKDHFSCSAKSELFWQLGLINLAQYYAYESMSGYSYVKDQNVRNMKRLLDCAIIKQDQALTTKYKKILDKTLFYRDYTEKQKKRLNDSSVFKMKNTISGDMSVVLASILEYNSRNQNIFEYLMAYYLLERDYEKAKECFDRYFPNFSYPHIPVHYAEFLSLYKRLNQLDDNFYKQYPVSRAICERFDMMDVLVSAKMTKQIQKTLEDGFKNTYWFYVRFPLVNVQTVKKDEKTIY